MKPVILAGKCIPLGITASMLFYAGSAFAKSEDTALLAEDYATLPHYTEAELSPNGEQIAYISNLDNRRVLVVEDLGGGNQIAIPALDDAEISNYHWANDNRLLVIYEFAVRRRGQMVQTAQTRMVAVDRAGQNFDFIVKPEKDTAVGSRFATIDKPSAQFQDDILDMLPDDPDHIILALDADHDGAYEIRRMDINTGEFEKTRDDERGIQNWIMDPNGDVRYASGYYDSKWNARLKLPSGRWQNLSDANWHKTYDLAGFAKDPNHIFVTGPSSHSTEGLYKLDVSSGKIVETIFEHPEVDVDYLIHHPNTGEPIGFSFTENQQKIQYFHPIWAKVQRVVDKSLPGMTNRIVSKARGKHIYLIHSSNTQEPGVYYLLDIKGKKLDVIYPSMPQIDPAKQSPTQAVSIPVRDGSTIPGYLTLPLNAKAKKLPTVIMPHGGPSARSSADWQYQAQFLARLGYAVLQPNFRGSTGYGRAFKNKGQKQWGGLMQDDVTDATKWLIKEKIADKKRICIVGGSYGGYAALMGAVKEPKLYRCAASINGVPDIPEMKVNDKHFIGGRAWVKNMTQEGVSDKDISPYHRADEIQASVLLIAAQDDARVDYRLSESMHKRLKSKGKSSQYLELEAGGHGLDTGVARLKTLQALEKFLNENIGK